MLDNFNYDKFLVVVGLQSGDEGKGKICDSLMSQYDICVRYSGSCNTGATVWVDGTKYKFHHLPVSLLQHKPAYIASACLLDPEKLLKEIEVYRALGIDVDRLLRISPDCHVITAKHISLDTAAENSEAAVGSTKRGVGPCASDKFGRRGIRLESLPEFEKYFADIGMLVDTHFQNGESVLFEGSQGTLLDVDHGLTYPNISTTSNIAGAACASVGMGPTLIDGVLGVFKPYITKVGKGPFPTEIKDEAIANMMVEKGQEFGTTTGRKRNVGWLDIPMLKYAIQRNGCTQLALTKFDVLEGMDISVCVGYKLNGEILKNIPVKKGDLLKAEPIYHSIKQARVENIIELVETMTGISVRFISTGPDRNELLEREV